MTMSNYDKLGLLRDLLQNQSVEQYMSTDEAEQIERLLSNLVTEIHFSPSIQQSLQEMQQVHKINHDPFEKEFVDQWLNVISE
ncbi:YtzH-like family protein [Bacillus solitudinis]|uniref:YtzH-like family protein n=1 Tax=Bacillus solitudinis TaxID=2014074 RepID=UPI000C244F05|nr:YtzH-like family protein [Bacillus solitudinis]